ncbi:MAG: TetR/AcrR family transcriptional regulator [Chloroflexi bacterium AL-W]|nr:TetR/AcrR family transcriptional regulator [Chloroflexi bacterium AL-N1]NOK68040.1 TetR/AcrR family transcriptional regulator [Chloroflexi bacterium AL-N10]NOK73380.1 TetR/AcrR family transcriptional regulator [Chloroflexi bacterium AL-N5]NOK83294.1 TetR/AcrR family transcriptional regulator [Chloroflexi bacterium AL-W]NOK87711.1 TetR/AcrR family transcriptional regulator [Chloroflexi bacterium AL-N15]
MPSRDDQTYEQRRQQIIDGALEVFARKGFEKATNKDIAQEAGIRSTGLIYHYFKDKADLLRQVLEQHAPILQLLNHSEEMMSKPPREVLTALGQAFLQIVEHRSAISAAKVMFGESARQPAIADLVNKIGPTRGVSFITMYLTHQIKMGTLRPINPHAAARTFIGSLMAFIVMREVFPQPDAQNLSAEEMVATTVAIFLQGTEHPNVE